MIERSKKVYLLLILITSLAAFAGCGYGFRATGEPVGIAIDSLGIPLFESSSTDRGFEAEFTEIIRNEFISRAKIPIVSREQAGAVLTGRIFEIDTQPLTYDTVRQSAGGTAVAYKTDGSRKLIVKLEITLKEMATGQIIWHDDSLEEEAYFKVSDDPLQNRYNKDQAIRNIAGLMAKKIYLNTMERF
jgi:hypothetical protein